VGFHPYFITTAAAAALPPNPYTLTTLFNSLPHNSPLRQLANLDSDNVIKGKTTPINENGSSYHHHHRHHHYNRSRSPSPDHWPEKKLKTDDDERDGDEEEADRRFRKNGASVILPSVRVKEEPDGENGDDDDRESMENKVRKILDTVNANVTRQQLLQACHFRNGESVGIDYDKEESCSSRPG